MKNWIKIFNHKTHGQVAAMNSTNGDNEPAIVIQWYPDWDHTGMLEKALGYLDETSCNDQFENITEEQVFNELDSTMINVRKMFEPASDIECWSCTKPMTFAQRTENDGDCIHCGVEIDMSEES